MQLSGFTNSTKVDEKVILDGDSRILGIFSVLEEECKNKMRMQEIQGYVKSTVLKSPVTEAERKHVQ